MHRSPLQLAAAAGIAVVIGIVLVTIAVGGEPSWVGPWPLRCGSPAWAPNWRASSTLPPGDVVNELLERSSA